MLILLLIWLAVGALLIWLVCGSQRASAGLPLAYFAGLSLIHVPGAVLYLDDELDTRAALTRVGFEQTIIGMVAFLVGVIIARHVFALLRPRQTSAKRAADFTLQRLAALDRLALLYLIIGALAYFVLMPLSSFIPSGTAIVSSLGSLLIVGTCLRLWTARESRQSLKFWYTVALLPALPLTTVMQGGFIGFGTYWAIAIASFVFAQSKRRSGFILLTPAVLFLGLSLFVNYMAARGDIRQLVWIEQASVNDRLQRIADVFWNFELLDFSNLRHREAIDGRLNQNWLVGAAVTRLDAGDVEYASGTTLGKAFISLIPRALWPDKPAVGGGGSVVHDFTGIEFASGTSVGAGQVLEFYVNFGTLGVIGGYLLYGWILGWMDLRIIECLRRGDQRYFLFWFLICLALLQPGGNLIEIVVSAASSAIAAYGLGHFLSRYGKNREIRCVPREMTSR
jgi:hypothetical protein